MFTRAITRKPCRALIDGISTAMFGEGKPDYDAAIAQHAAYVETLRELGLDVTVLEGDERVDEIARMLGGENATSVVLRHAQELLDAARGKG